MKLQLFTSAKDVREYACLKKFDNLFKETRKIIFNTCYMKSYKYN